MINTVFRFEFLKFWMKLFTTLRGDGGLNSTNDTVSQTLILQVWEGLHLMSSIALLHGSSGFLETTCIHKLLKVCFGQILRNRLKILFSSPRHNGRITQDWPIISTLKNWILKCQWLVLNTPTPTPLHPPTYPATTHTHTYLIRIYYIYTFPCIYYMYTSTYI